ncbi:DUF4097 domain-containing protein [Shewanella polaris]|uniref:DUF4097 domain-containing protein n=1 Tax=Shewanella polaris TaxID=2588449 RepID=A0A4Y5YBP6_9GAMM|nr:DUF4097 domain-containing protein [Shewanella polaris]QDE30115.1 DUF4097 domain-containing protein [Shewanella polaris]
MSIRIATISVTVGLILGATIFGASHSEAESVFSLSQQSDQAHPDLNLVQQQLKLDTGSLTELVAKTGAGKLTVVGVEGLKEVEVHADIYTPSLDQDDIEIKLSLTRKGDKAYLLSEIHSDQFFGESPFIDLLVKVPSTLALNIKDGSGSIKIEDVSADIELIDGSGSIVINNIGNLVLTDGSGSVVLNNTGKLSLIDGSGSINITDVNGGIILQDGSGSIGINNVIGDVSIDDGSGSIKVEQVSGLVKINDGSGGIDVANTKGLTIVNSGSGSVDYQNIDGPLSLD